MVVYLRIILIPSAGGDRCVRVLPVLAVTLDAAVASLSGVKVCAAVRALSEISHHFFLFFLWRALERSLPGLQLSDTMVLYRR
jgi:hypothetical protein